MEKALDILLVVFVGLGALLFLTYKIVVACQRLASHIRGEAPATTRTAVPTSPRLRRSSGARSSEVTYRSRNGRSHYEFDIRKLSDGYRIYIVSQPGYRLRDRGSHATHRLTDHRGSYVCWTGTLTTFKDARTVAIAWAECTEKYILRGTPFPRAD